MPLTCETMTLAVGLMLGTRLWYAMWDAENDDDDAFERRLDSVVREVGERGKLLVAESVPPARERAPPPAPAGEPAQAVAPAPARAPAVASATAPALASGTGAATAAVSACAPSTLVSRQSVEQQGQNYSLSLPLRVLSSKPAITL